MKNLWFLVVFILGLLIGLGGNEIITAKKASAAVKVQYKVVRVSTAYATDLQNILNAEAESGWRLYALSDTFAVLEK